jgi:hypothetical protein
MTTEELVDAAKKFRNAETAMKRRRDELFEKIRTAFVEADGELSKSEIARITGYTREHIARILGDE